MLNNTIHRTKKQYPSVMLFGVQQLGKVNDFLKETLEKFENSETRNLGGYKKRSTKEPKKFTRLKQKQRR